MSVEEDFSVEPEEPMEFIYEQKLREGELSAEKDELKSRINKIENTLRLLENRDDELTCMISTNNIYQLSTVKHVREALNANLTASMQSFVSVHRKLLRIQHQIRLDQGTLI
ncbi:uncharacterized protein LOC115623109 [Scaptodrosophila lebanonensis]|uniref:Uncharacterized protein LOC115623109 n=1 Tax=Drosophila lebanonensis TaxID=7225 RepID=A0A6J2TCR2_DROLE|nr:uncharacterized protein LOC115623109 [Scaptodrosophila lebanonensis]